MDLPLNELDRVACLHGCKLLDTPDEASYDEVTRLACLLCDAPIATVSLVDTNRQWFKAVQGIAFRETPRDISFCTHTILKTDEIFIVPDATKDPLFKENPLVVDGGIRFYAGAPLVTKQGYVLGSLCVLDKKPRKLSKEQLEGLRLLANRVEELIEMRSLNIELKELATVVDKSVNMVVMTDKNEFIEYVNPAFVKITGYSFDEVKGKKPSEILRCDHQDHTVDKKIKEAIKEKKSICSESLTYTKSGKPITISSNIIPIFDDFGNLENIISVQVDITDQKEKERELIEAKEEAQESVKLKQQFLSNISHEIRTPMNGVIGLSNLLLEENTLSPGQEETVKYINNSSKKLLRLINDILDLSKANVGKLSFKEEDFELNEVFNSLQQTMGILAREKGIAFKVKLDNELPEWVRGDSQRLNQILLNLAGNAVKFTHSGSVTVDVDLKTVNATGPLVMVKVIDTGTGIPEEKLEAIFDEFEQIACDIKDKSDGTGLGLSIVRKLVELYHGTIEVTSTPGEGSTFSFTVQLKNTKKVKPHEVPLLGVDTVEHSKASILVVEDNYVNQLVTRRYLEKAGYKVTIVENGLEGTKAHETTRFDLIIMDVQMPVMDGLEATKIIRSRDKDIPIIGMTASVMKEDLDLCYKAGMNSYIPKPFEPLKFYRMLDKFLKSKNKAA